MKHIKSYDKILTVKQKLLIKQDYLSGISIKKLCLKYNIKSKEYIRKLLKDIIRSTSESSKLAHKLYPEKFKLSDNAKEKVRQARLKYMKEHPEDTAWRKRNVPSYPEQCFINYLIDRGLDKKYIIEREKSFFPYFADFAFEQLKLVIEIDGSQHLEKERVESDRKKDKLIEDKGWKVIRLTENLVKTDWEAIDNVFNNYNNLNIQTKIFEIFKIIKNKFTKNYQDNRLGIFKSKKVKQKLPREENGLTKKLNEQHFKLRKVIWPSKNELYNLILNKPFTEIAKIYGVSDKTISKWCKYYKLPSTRKDIKRLLK